MPEFLQLMAAPFAACLVLTGIHAYLGLHVIEREVIFVDLALAQVAAFGATVGFLWGFGLHSPESYLISLLFTMVGAGVFAATRLRKPVVPQEALIGIVYAVAAAAAILVLSRAPEGGEELKSLLVGHLLFVEWPEIWKMAILYGAIGFLHWRFRRPLLLISRDPEAAFARGLKVRWWDFFFYATFGFVVTSSVEMAGVLLVFSFLIVPAVCGALLVPPPAAAAGGGFAFGNRSKGPAAGGGIGRRLWVGWGIGALASVLGVSISYWADLPTGATVVCVFGAVLLAAGFLRLLK